MAYNKAPWEYQNTSHKITEGETFSGHDKKFDPPLLYTTHRIISKGKKIIVETTLFTSSPENKRVEDNYHLIVQAVNSFVRELNT